jgi:hypothetical protein
MQQKVVGVVRKQAAVRLCLDVALELLTFAPMRYSAAAWAAPLHRTSLIRHCLSDLQVQFYLVLPFCAQQ